MSSLAGRDVLRLLLLEAAVQHLTDAGVIDEARVAAAVQDEVPTAVPVKPGTGESALDDAYRCLAALRRLDEVT